jgi:hypothetical protein
MVGCHVQCEKAAGGFEPPHRGFADPCLNLLATPPQLPDLLERKTGFEPATSSLARKHSTAELLPPQTDFTVFFQFPQANLGAEGEI